MQTALVIIHVIIAVVLTVIVLMKHGKQQGLSGAIAGGAETFFGKNKGRTVDAMLKKFTAVVAILFIVSSVVLTYVSIQEYASQNAVSDSASDEGTMNVSTDENGNLVDANGNIIMTAEDMQAAQAQQEAEAGAAEGADGAAEQGAAEGDAADQGAAQDGAADGAAQQDAAQQGEGQ